MLRVLKPDPSEDGVRHSEMPMSMCEAVSHLRGPGRVPSLPPYPWRSIPNVPGGALLQPHLGAARRPRCDLHVGQPAHHEKAEAATARACLGTQTNSVVDNLHRHESVCYPRLNLDPAVRVSGIRVYHRVRARFGKDKGNVIGKLLRTASTAFISDEKPASSYATGRPPQVSPETAHAGLLPSQPSAPARRRRN